jgi:tRNA A37 N6-isopentenylltransferase MiaA
MIAAGAAAEARRAAAGRLSPTARHVIGLHELTELPEAEAAAAIELRTRRYAAYQRKWMRRIPRLVSLNADRPPGEIADEILEVARARKLVPVPRAG